VFASAKVAVYVDGCFWHACPEHGTWPKANADWWRQKIQANVRRDRDSDLLLTEAGWLVLRFWEHEDPLEAAQLVARHVKGRRRARSTSVGGRS
jgi:DNA mismatch endonuclease (patch repair protein)